MIKGDYDQFICWGDRTVDGVINCDLAWVARGAVFSINQKAYSTNILTRDGGLYTKLILIPNGPEDHD
jgi:hypothetical protein